MFSHVPLETWMTGLNPGLFAMLTGDSTMASPVSSMACLGFILLNTLKLQILHIGVQKSARHWRHSQSVAEICGTIAATVLRALRLVRLIPAPGTAR